ncbi:MAG: hypothetical protein Q4G16_05025 [Cruoricaptor ignavus]|nr:hypothetical protein [Cruoricaptor ignavus]
MEITTAPFNAEFLENQLKAAFPDYLIKKSGKRIGVRKKKMTFTQHLTLTIKPEQGIVKSQNALYTAWALLIVGIAIATFNFWGLIFMAIPIIYVFAKSSSIKALEKQVMDKVKEILNNSQDE